MMNLEMIIMAISTLYLSCLVCQGRGIRVNISKMAMSIYFTTR